MDLDVWLSETAADCADALAGDPDAEFWALRNLPHALRMISAALQLNDPRVGDLLEEVLNESLSEAP